MKITIKELRQIINRALVEAGGGVPTKPMFGGKNPESPEAYDREQLGYLADQGGPETHADDILPPHLRNPTEDPEDCFGPVPPVQGDPYVMQDPFAVDTSPLPTSTIKR